MPNRILKESICESRSLADSSFFAEDLYKRLITYADDYGRFNADPQIMLARLYPRELDVVTSEELINGLVELAGVGKIAFYLGTSSHKKDVYGCFPNWGEHQRVRDSKKRCPDPANTEINDWYLRRFVPMSMKIDILQRDDFTCAECGKKIAETDNARAVIKFGAGLFHIDHIVPVNQGGRATMENLRVLCPKCNLSRKRYLSFDEILSFADSCGNSQKVAENSGKLPPNPIQSYPYPNPYPNPNPNPMIDDEDAIRIQNEHNQVLDAAQNAGFKSSPSERARLLRLYEAYGLEKMLAGISECVDHSATSLAYLDAVLKGTGKKQKSDARDVHGYEQRDYADEQKKALERMMNDEDW